MRGLRESNPSPHEQARLPHLACTFCARPSMRGVCQAHATDILLNVHSLVIIRVEILAAPRIISWFSRMTKWRTPASWISRGCDR
jgi:hypothetical protein